MQVIFSDSLVCEPILRRMPNGELLCVTQHGDVSEPAPGNRVSFFHSADEGRTWSEPRLIWPEDGQAVYQTEVAVIGDRVIVYLTIHNGHFVHWRCERMESMDSGHTWKAIGPVTGFETYTFPRSTIRLRDGRLMMAMQHYPVSPQEDERLAQAGLKGFDAQIDQTENTVLVSSDEGHSWTRLGSVNIPIQTETGRRWCWGEPTLMELEDGRIVMLLRIDRSGQLWRSESSDGGRTFSPVVATGIPNPSNKPKLLRLEDGRIALIHTPCATHGMSNRHPLSVWLSDDEMATFSDRRIIAETNNAYSYSDGVTEGTHLRFTVERDRRELLFYDLDLK